MLQVAPLYLASLGIAGVLWTLARYNRKLGWRRQRTFLTEEIQDSMMNLLAHQPPAVAPSVPPNCALTPEAHLGFSLQLAKLHSTLAAHGSTAPAPQTSPHLVHAFISRD